MLTAAGMVSGLFHVRPMRRWCWLRGFKLVNGSFVVWNDALRADGVGKRNGSVARLVDLGSIVIRRDSLSGFGLVVC